MVKKIKISAQSVGVVYAELLEERSPKTCKAIVDSLPLVGEANIWGEEVYFPVGLDIEPESPVQDVEVGDVAYWPPGKAICIFYGPTPISTTDKPKAYSPVNVFAKIIDPPEVFKAVKHGERITVDRA